MLARHRCSSPVGAFWLVRRKRSSSTRTSSSKPPDERSASTGPPSQGSKPTGSPAVVTHFDDADLIEQVILDAEPNKRDKSTKSLVTPGSEPYVARMARALEWRR